MLDPCAREQQALLCLSQTLLGLLEPKAIAHATFEAIGEHLQPDGVGLYVPNGLGTELELVAARGWMEACMDELRVRLERPELSGAAWAVHTRAPVCGNHSRPDRPFAGPEAAHRAEVKACLHVPMLIQQQVVGVLTATRLTPGAYSQDDVRFLSLVANLAGIALDRAREHQAVREAEAGYRQSHQEYVALVNSVDGIVWEVDAQTFRFSLVSQQAERLLGYPVARWLAEPDFWSNHIHPEDRESAVNFCLSATKEKRDHAFQYRMIAADGRTVWLHDTVTVVVENDEVVKLRGVMVDITECKWAEAALVQRTRQLEAVRAVGEEITREMDLNILLGLITERAVELCGASAGAVHLWHEATQVLTPRAWRGLGSWMEDEWLKLGEGVVGTVAERREGMNINDYRTSPYATPLILARTRIAAVLAEPLQYRDRLVGVISIGNNENERPFTEKEREPLALFAAQAAIAIENARLHETTRRRAQQLARLNEVTRTLAAALDPQAVGREILAAVQVLIPGAVGHLWEWVAGEGGLRLMSGVGLRDPGGGFTPRFSLDEGFPGISASTREPIISRDITRDPRYINKTWAAAQGLVSGIVVPLLYGEVVKGALAIYTPEPHDFNDQEVSLLRSLAAHAAVALENAELFQSVREQEAHLRALTTRLSELEEDHRRRLSAELHDRVGQNLAALDFNLNFLRSQLPAELAGKIADRLNDSMALVEATIEHIRDVTSDLRPPVLDDYGLLAALRWYGKQFSTRTGVAVHVNGEEPIPRLPPTVEMALFRITQEQLTNVGKHAQASRVDMTLEAMDGEVRLTIADDGVGYDLTRPSGRSERHGWGLITMRERAAAIGGSMDVESTPGRGTQVIVQVKK